MYALRTYFLLRQKKGAASEAQIEINYFGVALWNVRGTYEIECSNDNVSLQLWILS